MRRKDREVSPERAWEIVDSCPFATMSILDEEGKPYGVPVSIARDGENLYFHAALEGRKIDCLKKNPYVSVSCVAKAENAQDDFTVYYASAILEGRAEEITEKEQKLHGLELLCRKYMPHLMGGFKSTRKNIFRIQACGKYPSFPSAEKNTNLRCSIPHLFKRVFGENPKYRLKKEPWVKTLCVF